VRKIILSLATALTISHSAFAADVNFNSLVCRSYDYYQLGGDRNVTEVAVLRDQSGGYRITVAKIYEILVADQDYRERDRSTEFDLKGLTCTQALAVDAKVVTCATFGIQNYFDLARLDHTLVLSAFSSHPGKVVETTTYEGTFYGDKNAEYHGFDAQDCVLN
jgi:hypothetical protein